MSQSRNASSGTPAPRASDLALWSAANLAGMMTQVLVMREPLYRRLMNRIAGKRRRRVLKVQRPSPQESLPLLAEAVIGSSKISILNVFGPPRTAVLDTLPSPQATVLQSQIWYYPLPRNGPLAMAISFDEHHASGVEFFEMLFSVGEPEQVASPNSRAA